MKNTELTSLADEINAETAKAESAARTTIEHAMRAGELLVHAKDQIPHGQWEQWLETNCRVKKRMAQRYMRLFKERDKVKSAPSTYLTIAEADKLTRENSEAGKLTRENFAIPDGFDFQSGQCLVGLSEPPMGLVCIFLCESVSHPSYWNMHVFDFDFQLALDGFKFFGTEIPFPPDVFTNGYFADVVSQVRLREQLNFEVVDNSDDVNHLRECGDRESKWLCQKNRGIYEDFG